MATQQAEPRRIALPELGISTRVLVAGTGPVVLMLHGNPDNADEWALLIERLAGRYRCIAPDFPGYGYSPEPPASFTYSLADQMRFVDAVLRTMAVAEPVILVVHDTGGMVGTAGRRPISIGCAGWSSPIPWLSKGFPGFRSRGNGAIPRFTGKSARRSAWRRWD
jgi:pimeloyl-ACP methyl ester carboxylesterase